MSDTTVISMSSPAPSTALAGSPPAVDPASPGPTAKAARHWRFPYWVAGVAGVLAVAAGVVYIPHRYVEETDDAYVQADTVAVVPKIAGYVTALHVTDNSRFTANQLLVEIDTRDFQVAVDSAEANLQSTRAAKANVLEQLTEQTHVIAAAQATIDGDRATLQFAGQQLARYSKLAGDGAATAERWQQAQSDLAQRKADLEHDLATLAAAQAQVGVLQSQDQQADAAIAREQAALAQAKLNLSYTQIRATSSGSVANRTVQVGDFVQQGQTLFSAVPNETYVIANFKETQLAHMRAGQSVSVQVDAFSGEKLHGHIDSFQRGTGSSFALLPPENATGNFIKIVQRIPVKIILDGPAESLHAISPGMSVEAAVTLTPPPGWLAPFLGSVASAAAGDSRPGRGRRGPNRTVGGRWQFIRFWCAMRFSMIEPIRSYLRSLGNVIAHHATTLRLHQNRARYHRPARSCGCAGGASSPSPRCRGRR
jgi:membrane fusion protein, multidrug efflux system